MIVVTGGAGFIGSAFAAKLNDEGIEDVVIVDELGTTDKWKNLVKRRYADYLDKAAFLALIESGRIPFRIDAIVHMGACSSTTERDAGYLMENNFHYTCRLADWALEKGVRFLYASSAATYGDGVQGFSDADTALRSLKPINMYGYSKHLFDLWLLRNRKQDRVAGLKFFNVFGPNEYHKGDMTSVIFKAFHQIRETGKVRLFKSYRPEYGDGGQMRDFVYVKDCVEVLWWLLQHPEANGIFNLGTGRARTWNDLIGAVFAALDLPPKIEYIEMPEAIRGQYQYFTEAQMDKLAAAGCPLAFGALETSVGDYVKSHLLTADPYL
ncbi:MAG: ADP-glyceromanno-heptose 6-epimerase [Deltaproteobacteria bacterium]|nr:ADP-glyceromanno-heptose 6-epimerase [Deltaproteobacteria bacterium]